MSKLKLESEVSGIVTLIRDNREHIISHKARLEAAGHAKSIQTRLVWDIMRWLKGDSWICSLYNKGADDGHITSLGVHCLALAGVI
mgnify:CR=1 FL=1